MATIDRKWWKEGTAYQIWPTSYKDSNGDGIGDLPGIISKLDYLQDLGIDIIWVSPAYASPKKDMGYDISDYENIDPQYGTLADAERLIAECHRRGMRLLFDLVVNHTSDQHAWFKESRSSRDNPKRDWYIWRPPRYDANGKRQPPNNWRAIFGGSAWEWDEATQEYYFHLFVPEQPDLNWENPATREAIYDSAIRFWVDKGIDGFRIDTANLYSKPSEFEDAPITDPNSEFQLAPSLWTDGPRMHEFMREMHAAMRHRDVATVGELGGTKDPKDVLLYVSAARGEMDLVFQFDVVNLGKGFLKGDHFKAEPFSLTDIKSAFTYIQDLPANPDHDGWGAAFLENHDQPRSVTRFGSDQPPHRARSAKLLSLLLVALSGTLFIYQGQEVGVKNAPAEWGPENYRDVEVLNYLAAAKARHPEDPTGAVERAMEGIRRFARDHSRAPVPWSREGPYAGFTDASATPWMPLHPDFAEGWNVADQLRDPESVLAFWKTALRLRKERPGVFVYGTFRVAPIGDDRLFVFEKVDVAGFDAAAAGTGAGVATAGAAGGTVGTESGSAVARAAGTAAKAIVVANFTAERQPLELEPGTKLVRVLLGNVENGRGDPAWLEPWEGRIYEAL